MYVPVRYGNGISAFFSKNSYVPTDLHTYIKLFIVPRESTDFKSVSWHFFFKRIRVYYYFQKSKK